MHMKHLFAILILLALADPLIAQKQQNLFDSPIEHGFVGCIGLKLTSIKNEDAFMVGGYGGLLLDHRLMIGLGGFGMVNKMRARREAEIAYSPYQEPLYIRFGYGGLLLEYIIWPANLVHIDVRTLIGAGGVAYHYGRFNYSGVGYMDHHGTGISEILFVAEPGVSVELNVTDFLRIAAGASYRHVSGVADLQGLDDRDLSGFSGDFALKFGPF